MKRTDVDFSKHILTETHFKDELTGHTLDVWELKVKGTMWGRVIFVNSCNSLTIDGDYGRFSFCREFHPSAKGAVSDGYWCEKLRMNSVQSCSEWDGELAEKELRRWIDDDLKDWCTNDETIEFFEDLMDSVYDETEYTYKLYRECPADIDYEYLPMTKKMHPRLEVVFDAFEEICKRIKETDELQQR